MVPARTVSAHQFTRISAAMSCGTLCLAKQTRLELPLRDSVYLVCISATDTAVLVNSYIEKIWAAVET
jgi:hypothetical protein